MLGEFVRATAALVAISVVLSGASAADAGTIIKLSLGSDPLADIEYSSGVLSTINDGDGATPGDQNTAIEFLDFLSFIPNIPSADASYSLDGVAAAGPATVMFGSAVFQPLSGGFFKLWDDSPVPALLLHATLDDSLLSGTVGGPAAGAVFSTSFGSVLGGTLAPYIDPTTVSISISLTSINGGAGLSVTPSPLGTLQNFVADATEAIAAEPVPEPATAALLILAAVGATGIIRRR